MADFWSELRPASWRGFAFGVDGTAAAVGRRNAVHEYPFRDLPWVEDLGQQAKRFRVLGFIVGDDVINRRNQLLKLAESAGDGELVHPTYGTRKVALMDLQIVERKDRGRFFELQFTFIQQGAQVYPTATDSTQAATKVAVTAASEAAQLQWVQSMKKTLSAASQAFAQVSSLTKEVVATIDSFGVAAGLQPGRLGLSLATMAGDLLAGRKSRVAQNLALDALSAAAANLNTSTLGKYAASAVYAVGAAVINGGSVKDAIRSVLAIGTRGYLVDSSPIPTGYPAGAQMAAAEKATQALYRRASAIEAANLSADFSPTSAGEAGDVRDMVAQALQDEALAAADSGDDDAYRTLVNLRAAVVSDLNARAAQLPTRITVRTPQPVPSLVLAYKLYGDASRSDELVGEAAPVHPAFMPTSFRALSE